MNLDPRNRQLSEAGGHLRIVDTAVVKDKAGAGKGHARLLRLELQLDDMVVPCGVEPTTSSGEAKTSWEGPTESDAGWERGARSPTGALSSDRTLIQQCAVPGQP